MVLAPHARSPKPRTIPCQYLCIPATSHPALLSRKYQVVAAVAKRKLDQLHAAAELADLRAIPGNRLEALSGDRRGQYSIRINDQWRICFRWTAADASEVEIVDYH